MIQIFLTMHVQELQELGLSERQAKVYLMLLQMGDVTVGPLSQQLQMHKQSVYDVLAELQNAGVVCVEENASPRVFSAVDPSVFLTQQKERDVLLSRLVPELSLLQGSEQYVSEIKTYSGLKAVHTFHEQQMKRLSEGANIDVLGAGGDRFLEFATKRAFFDRYENIRIKKKITHRLLMFHNQRDTDSAYTQRRYVDVRYLSDALQQMPMATQIWPDSIVMLLFGEEPQVVHIKSKRIRDGFLSYFESLWGVAEE